jgi:hypothetical protein
MRERAGIRVEEQSAMAAVKEPLLASGYLTHQKRLKELRLVSL